MLLNETLSMQRPDSGRWRRLRATASAVSVAVALGATWTSGPARAEEPLVVAPTGAVIPQQLSLDEALNIFRAQGLDLLMAQANVVAAEGDVGIAGAIPNPTINAGVGRTFNYDPKDYSATGGPACVGCSVMTWTAGISDGAAIADTLSGKRGLRLAVARKALDAAKLTKFDAQRQLEFIVKSQYVQVAFAKAAVVFAYQVAEGAEKSFELNRDRYTSGKIDEGTLARVQTAKLEADQQVDIALSNLRQEQLGLAYILGARSTVPDFDIDGALMKGLAIPSALKDVSEDTLTKAAMDNRPDYRAYAAMRDKAQAEIDLAKRLSFPDFVLSLQYTQTGTSQNALLPPTLVFGITMPIPLFYTYSGEQKKAEADYALQSLAQAKSQAQIVSDVGNAFTAYVTSRRLVERMEGGLLAAAEKAASITKIQFEAGATTLMDYLDAQRTYIATRVEYLTDLTSYWTAVYQLEQATGTELRK